MKEGVVLLGHARTCQCTHTSSTKTISANEKGIYKIQNKESAHPLFLESVKNVPILFENNHKSRHIKQ